MLKPLFFFALFLSTSMCFAVNNTTSGSESQLRPSDVMLSITLSKQSLLKVSGKLYEDMTLTQGDELKVRLRPEIRNQQLALIVTTRTDKIREEALYPQKDIVVHSTFAPLAITLDTFHPPKNTEESSLAESPQASLTTSRK